MVKEIFLVAGEVTYQMPDSNTKFFRRVNAITGRPIQYSYINGEDLSYFSHSVLENFHATMESEGYAKEAYIIKDIVILFVTPLGSQEMDEFTPKIEKAEPEEKEEPQQ